MTTLRPTYRLVLSLSILCSSFSLMANGSSLFDKMIKSGEILQISLNTDIETLLLNKKTKEWQQAQIQYMDNEGVKQDWVIEIRPRGNFRRRVCDFPPIKIKFPKKKMGELGLGKHNDLKLVTHCLTNDQADQLVLKEYLIYKMYEILSPQSFRVQMVKIYYINAKNFKRYDVRYGILLEDEDEMADRYGSKVCDDCYGMEATRFTEHNQATLGLFQYMVENHDWSFHLNRNIKILKTEKENEKSLAVPYDFDFSKWVGAPYAILQEVSLPESSKNLEEAINHFLTKKDLLYALVEEEELLLPTNRKNLMEELRVFFKEMERLKKKFPSEG